MTRHITLALASLLLVTATADAAQLSLMQKMELQRACRADSQTLCGGQEPGEGRLAQCLRDNATKLSEPCRTTIDALRGDFFAATDAAMDY